MEVMGLSLAVHEPTPSVLLCQGDNSPEQSHARKDQRIQWRASAAARPPQDFEQFRRRQNCRTKPFDENAANSMRPPRGRTTSIGRAILAKRNCPGVGLKRS